MLDHSDDPAVERELDGNALAGLFESLFGGDMTTVPGRCAHCHTVNMVGAMRVYLGGPGAVLRCPACDEVVMRIVETKDEAYIDARGAAYLRFRRGWRIEMDEPITAGDTTWAGLDGLLLVRAALHDWARANPDIQAAVAVGSTERTDRPHDAWADLDLLFVVEDRNAWLDDLDWVDEIRPSWIRLINTSPLPDIQVVQVLFAGGYDADLIPIEREQVAILEVPDVASEIFGHGATLLFDRSGAFSRLTAETGAFPTSTVEPVRPPTAAEFEQTVSVFLYQTVWATKRLLRGERWRAHDDVDDYMRDRMLRMLEWHALARGVEGVLPESRQLERWVPPDIQAQLPATFAAYADDSIADALVRSQDLFRRLAHEVADRWGLTYPEAVDAEIEEWVRERLAERRGRP